MLLQDIPNEILTETQVQVQIGALWPVLSLFLILYSLQPYL